MSDHLEITLQQQLLTQAAAIKHLQANLAEMVSRNALLRQRPDLPLDRIPEGERLIAKIKDLTQRLATCRAFFEDLETGWADTTEVRYIYALDMYQEARKAADV